MEIYRLCTDHQCRSGDDAEILRLVPSLLSAIDDPFVKEKQAYWGGQAVWTDILATLPKIVPSRGTAFQSDADAIYKATQTKYFAVAIPMRKQRLTMRQSRSKRQRGCPSRQ